MIGSCWDNKLTYLPGKINIGKFENLRNVSKVNFLFTGVVLSIRNKLGLFFLLSIQYLEEMEIII